MIEARPIRPLSKDFGIEIEGQIIALLKGSLWREASEISIEGRPYKLYRENPLSGAFVLEGHGQTVARATKPSAFRSQFDIEIEGRQYSLGKDSIFSRSFSVLQGEAQVGSIRPASFFTRRTIVDLPSDWSLPVQVFVFWLALVIWNRDDAGAAAGA